MLTDDEQSAFQESIARVRQLAARSLRQAANADEAITFVMNLHRSLDTVAEQAGATGPAPDCKAGCAHCCHVRVEATDPEVFHIARHLQALPATALAAVAKRLQQHAETARQGAPRQACSFLQENRCTIYTVRPAVCRKAHSLSVQHCASLAPQIPQNLRLLVDAEALMAGTAQAYADAAMPAHAHELNAAVWAALRDPTALRRWYEGDAAVLEHSHAVQSPGGPSTPGI
ncbi:MAG: YkgJ family cysteine cluster protein [Acidovorax sp.]|nr:YkgJ family cysteine cluster protein [Acidovorax sp.]